MPYLVIGRAAGDDAPVSRPRGTVHRIRVPAVQLSDRTVGTSVPDPHRAVLASGAKPGGARVEIDGPDAPRVAREAVDERLAARVPNPHQVIPAGGGQEGAAGGEVGPEHPARVLREGGEVLPVLCVPESRCVVRGASADNETVGAEPRDAGDGDAVHAAESEDLLQVAELPHVDLLVPACAGQSSAVRAEGQVRYLPSVGRQPSEFIRKNGHLLGRGSKQRRAGLFRAPAEPRPQC